MPPKKPTTNTALVSVCFKGSAGDREDSANNYKCTDPQNGKTQMVKFKTSPKQKLPHKLSMAELDKICGFDLREQTDLERKGD